MLLMSNTTLPLLHEIQFKITGPQHCTGYPRPLGLARVWDGQMLSDESCTKHPRRLRWIPREDCSSRFGYAFRWIAILLQLGIASPLGLACCGLSNTFSYCHGPLSPWTAPLSYLGVRSFGFLRAAWEEDMGEMQGGCGGESGRNFIARNLGVASI